MEDLEKIRPYEPNVVKAAYNIFGKSYAYREKYNAYKNEKMKKEAERKRKERENRSRDDGQECLEEFL